MMNVCKNLETWDSFVEKAFEGAGPTGKPRGGKYISREWKGDHWEYTYADDPKPHHGVQNAHSDEHSMNLPSKVDEGLHQRAQQGDQRALKEIYEASRGEAQSKPLTVGDSWQAKHPVSGEDMLVTVRNVNGVPHLVAMDYKKDEQGNIITDKKGNPKGDLSTAKRSKTWEGLQDGLRKLADTKEITDSSGLKLYIVPIGSFDEETRSWPGAKESDPKREGSRRYEIKAPSGSPIKIGKAKGRSPSLEEATRKAELLLAYHRRSQNPNSLPASEILSQGISPSEALSQGMLPVEAKSGKKIKDRLENKFSSPEEKEQFKQALFNEKEEMILTQTSKMGIDPDPSMVDDALDSVVRNYGTTNDKRSLDEQIIAKIAWRAGNSARKQKGETSFDHNIGAANQAAQEAYNEDPQEATEELSEDDEQTEHNRSMSLHSLINSNLDRIREKAPTLSSDLDTLKKEAEVFIRPEFSGRSAQEKLQVYGNKVMDILDKNGLDPREFLSLFIPHPKSNEFQEIFQKSIAQIYASLLVSREERLIKAVSPPSYYKKEGLPENPRFYYKDSNDNFIRFTNAPKGHEDYDDVYGEPNIHISEPTMESAPQFFTPDGRKLTRAPFTGAPVEWNQSYHKEDTKNLWAARWVNPVTGEHEYSYIDSDIRELPNLQINRINSLIDTRIPILRQYYTTLLKSNQIKDQVIGLMLALVDQGRFRIRELIRARVCDVKISKNIMFIGNRSFYADTVIRQRLLSLVANKPPNSILFVIPTVDINGGINHEEPRRIGMHTIINTLEALGVPIQGLQTYHASQAYSSAMQDIYCQNNVTWECAHHFALLEVASELSHNLNRVPDYEIALQAIESSAIDPIVVNSIKNNCQELGLGGPGASSGMSKPVYSSVHLVSANLIDKTEEEKEFSRWLHTAPIHNYLEI